MRETSNPPQIRPVLTGLDVLERENFAPIKNKRIAIITNQSAIDSQGRHLLDVLVSAKSAGITVTKIFSPEHGLYGAVDHTVGDTVEPKTGLHVYSLYGQTRRPSDAMLQDVDLLLFDIQDVGARFYTFESTMGICMQEAAKHHIPYLVLDRPNPITGTRIGGPIADKKYFGFTAFGPHPLMHGMTIGELARYFNSEYNIHADLTVIPCENWHRNQWFDSTGLLWINPSPNMRNLTQAELYPCTCLLEATNISVGRGTDQPFEFFGAPWIDNIKLSDSLNNAHIPGLRFTPFDFTPTESKFKGQLCHGIYILVTNRDALHPVDAGMTIVWTLHHLFPKDFESEKVKRLLQNDAAYNAMLTATDPTTIPQSWSADLATFQAKREPYLLYK
ncbi:MAG TPA: DUF1343 domain-containing protein [Tepidisphaeraceae bacterium]|nr:DUF1343 domain-containing protein [Tepidisphaeraceae bacterium]